MQKILALNANFIVIEPFWATLFANGRNDNTIQYNKRIQEGYDKAKILKSKTEKNKTIVSVRHLVNVSVKRKRPQTSSLTELSEIAGMKNATLIDPPFELWWIW